MKVIVFEPRHEKTCIRGFRPGPPQTGLYSHRRWLEIGKFGFDFRICPLLFTYDYMVSIGEVSSSSGRLGRAALFFVTLPEPSMYCLGKRWVALSKQRKQRR